RGRSTHPSRSERRDERRPRMLPRCDSGDERPTRTDLASTTNEQCGTPEARESLCNTEMVARILVPLGHECGPPIDRHARRREWTHPWSWPRQSSRATEWHACPEFASCWPGSRRLLLPDSDAAAPRQKES